MMNFSPQLELVSQRGGGSPSGHSSFRVSRCNAFQSLTSTNGLSNAASHSEFPTEYDIYPLPVTSPASTPERTPAGGSFDKEFQRAQVNEETMRLRAQRLVNEKQTCTLSGLERENRKKAIKILLCEARRHQKAKKEANSSSSALAQRQRGVPVNNRQQQQQQPQQAAPQSLDLTNNKMFKVVANDLSILMKEDAVLRRPRTGHTLPKGCVDNYFFVTTELSLLRLW